MFESIVDNKMDELDFDYNVVLDYFPYVDVDDFDFFLNSLKTRVADRDLKLFNCILYFNDFYYSFIEPELERVEMILEIDLNKSLLEFMNFIEGCINI